MQKGIVSETEYQADVREIATEILTKVDTRKAYADLLLDNALRSSSVEQRNRALLTELTYGTLRWRGRLDACLKPYLRRPLPRTEPFLANLLRLSLYQSLFLDRIPDYAAVDAAVNLAKKHGGAKAGAFINAVLRSFLRTKIEPVRPDPKTASIPALAAYWSHPEWLVRLWREYFAPESFEALLQANNEPASLVLRTNPRTGTRDRLLNLLQNAGVRATPSRFSPQAIIVESSGAADLLPGYTDGLFQVQAESSQLVSYLLAPKPGDHVLDACAAPGGKTTHLAELMEDCGEITAVDVSEKGLGRLRDNVARLGLKSIRLFRADLAQSWPEPIKWLYDRILVDAPCSGLGTLRSHPEIKWNRNENDIERLSRLQREILVRAASCVKAGGVLVYSTCTLSRKENEDVIENFLSGNNGFVLEHARDYLPGGAKTLVRGSYFLALPHLHNTDGFFAARLRKQA